MTRSIPLSLVNFPLCVHLFLTFPASLHPLPARARSLSLFLSLPPPPSPSLVVTALNPSVPCFPSSLLRSPWEGGFAKKLVENQAKKKGPLQPPAPDKNLFARPEVCKSWSGSICFWGGKCESAGMRRKQEV